MPDYMRLLALSDGELAGVGPLVANLLVAKSIPSLADLAIDKYHGQVNQLSKELRRRLPGAEAVFHDSPDEWGGDINFFRLGVLYGVIEGAGIQYKMDQRNATAVAYTDPSDLFLTGVLDTRRGTCGNMAALFVAVGRSLGWPVSLAAVRSHFVCRYDDRQVTYNIETTRVGLFPGMFDSPPDHSLVRNYAIPPTAIRCGSDLRALTPREELGVYIGFRARHMCDTGRLGEAEVDYLLARRLYPTSRALYRNSLELTLSRGATLFDPNEVGSPRSVADEVARQTGQATANPTTHAVPAYTTVIHGVIY